MRVLWKYGEVALLENQDRKITYEPCELTKGEIADIEIKYDLTAAGFVLMYPNGTLVMNYTQGEHVTFCESEAEILKAQKALKVVSNSKPCKARVYAEKKNSAVERPLVDLT